MSVRWVALVGFVGTGCTFHHAVTGGGDDAGSSDASVDARAADAPPPDARHTPPDALAGATILLPCSDANQPATNLCHTGPAPSTQVIQLVGGPTMYSVTLRVRGVMEKNKYKSGKAEDGGWYVGGTPNSGSNVFRLDVSDPVGRFYLNAAPSDQQSGAARWDYVATLAIAGDAVVTLTGDATDTLELMNIGDNSPPFAFADLTTPAQPYDGEFVRLDVMDVQ